MERLTEKQQTFVIEYLKNPNASRAALLAGYSPKTAYSQGQRLLKNVVIQECINRYRSELFQGLQLQFITDALTAKNVMTRILNDPDASDRDRIMVARDFLDRAGFKPINKNEVSGSNGASIEMVFISPE